MKILDNFTIVRYVDNPEGVHTYYYAANDNLDQEVFGIQYINGSTNILTLHQENYNRGYNKGHEEGYAFGYDKGYEEGILYGDFE